MNKLTFTTAIFMAMTTTSVFAHHPAADIVDPEVYEMIDDNVADTPHADMVFDDMGSAMDQAVAEQSGPMMEMEGAVVDIDVAMDTADSVDTMILIESVDNMLTE